MFIRFIPVIAHERELPQLKFLKRYSSETIWAIFWKIRSFWRKFYFLHLINILEGRFPYNWKDHAIIISTTIRMFYFILGGFFPPTHSEEIRENPAKINNNEWHNSYLNNYILIKCYVFLYIAIIIYCSLLKYNINEAFFITILRGFSYPPYCFSQKIIKWAEYYLWFKTCTRVI